MKNRDKEERGYPAYGRQSRRMLTGAVDSREAKRRAEDVVDNISGVKHVQNNLRVEVTGAGRQSGNWTSDRTSSTEAGTLSQSEATRSAKT